jgi:hypothetical protein
LDVIVTHPDFSKQLGVGVHRVDRLLVLHIAVDRDAATQALLRLADCGVCGQAMVILSHQRSACRLLSGVALACT